MRVVERRIDVAIAVEEQEVYEVEIVAARRGRPIGAVVTDTVEIAVISFAFTRSRIPNSGSCTELVGEVHAFVCATI